VADGLDVPRGDGRGADGRAPGRNAGSHPGGASGRDAGTPAPAIPAWKPFQELAFLTGSWTGTASLGARFGGRVARFGPELSGAFFVVRGSTFLAADEGGREETLEEEGWFAYDREKRKYVATWFFSNGVTGAFDVELLPDGVRLLSRELVNYESGTRARLLFQRRPEGDVAMNVDLAAPGKDFVPWLVSALKKK
jgi:hypothetical protein